ncbi:hypothetical protein BsWGS_13187 [Bradybaena similaris]
MSEEGATNFCVRHATPKHREIWRNIALLAWIMGLVPSMVAIVTLAGTSLMFAILVILNSIFIIFNCGFCCVNVQSLKKRRIFYITCLAFMVVITVMIMVTIVTKPEDDFQIVGFVGCGLTFISCVAFVILNILLHIHGPVDPVSSDSNCTPEQTEDSPSEILTIRYVSAVRGTLQEESIFRVQAGQILSRPQTGHSTNTTERSHVTQNRRLLTIFGFRIREESEPERERRESIESLPIHIISEGVHNSQRRNSTISQLSLNSQRTFNSQRRDSSISLMSYPRRISTSSIEYDTTSVRCTCYYVPNETTDDSDEVPRYSETPTGNMTVCPLHGENPIPPPSYDNSTSTYNSLCRILGLPEYDEVITTKPVILSSTLKDASESSPSDILPTTSIPTSIIARQLMDSSNRTGTLSDRFPNVQATFETIFEDRSERSDSFLSESALPESDVAAASSTAPSASTTETAAAPSASTSETTAAPSASTTETAAAPSASTTETTAAPSASTTETTAAPSASTTETTAAPSASTTETAALSTTGSTTETTAAAYLVSPSITVTEAAADELLAAISTTAASFINETTFSTSKQTA